MFDVLIAGAGPAGAVAATLLARGGARVLVLDRARFPRDKLCGDTLNPGALGVLSRLGLDTAVAGGLPLDGMIVTGTGVRVVGRYTPEGGNGVNEAVCGRALVRRTFDAALVSAASAAGARVEENVLVDGAVTDTSAGVPAVAGLVIKGKDGRPVRIAAPIVIAADGRYSRVARALGLSRSRPPPASMGHRRVLPGRGRDDVLRRDARARRTLHRCGATSRRSHQRLRRHAHSRLGGR